MTTPRESHHHLDRKSLRLVTGVKAATLLIRATSERWPGSVARKDCPSSSSSFATGAPTRLAAPVARPGVTCAPWANVGALVALVSGPFGLAPIRSGSNIGVGDDGVRSRSPRLQSAARSSGERDGRSWSASARTRTRCEVRR